MLVLLGLSAAANFGTAAALTWLGPPATPPARPPPDDEDDEISVHGAQRELGSGTEARSAGSGEAQRRDGDSCSPKDAEVPAANGDASHKNGHAARAANERQAGDARGSARKHSEELVRGDEPVCVSGFEVRARLSHLLC